MLALVLLAFGAPALGGAWRACEHHEAAAPAGAAGHDAHDGGHSTPEPSSPEGPCDCVGACNAPATPLAAAAPAVLTLAVADRLVTRPAVLPEAAPDGGPRLLPFANGPPAIT